MSFLKPGTLCVIVAGCPENIGLIVEVIRHLGRWGVRADAYRCRTVSGRDFPQFRVDGSQRLVRGTSSECITDRHKLRPLVDLHEGEEATDAAQNAGKVRSNATPEAKLTSLVVDDCGH
ncbi:MAG: hypothetical protein V5B30_12265 [Candidatus Accumulibacter delftensis]|jgi:hypothetical protein